MSQFTHRDEATDLVEVLIQSGDGLVPYLASRPVAVAVTSLRAVVKTLQTEAIQTALATQAMADANHREHVRQLEHITHLNEVVEDLHRQNGRLNQALATAREQVATALDEVKRLDAKLVAAEMDLGQARDDNRALHVQLADALNLPLPNALTGKPAVLTPEMTREELRAAMDRRTQRLANQSDGAHEEAAYKRHLDGLGDE
jgi:hypothetical protein